MRFTCTLLSLYATLLVANPLPADSSNPAITPRDGDDCSNVLGFIEPGVNVGNQQSGRWCAAKWSQGIFPNEIEAWADKNCLRWIRIKFTDGTEQSQGSWPGDDGHNRYGTVKWNPWIHTFAKFSLWDGGWNNGVGRIVLEVANQLMDAGKYWDNPPAEHSAARGIADQGMLLGIEGSSGDCIDSLRPIFSKYRPEKVILTEANFEPTFEQLNERPFDQRMMTVVHSTVYLRNDRKDAEVTLKAKIDIATEHQAKVTSQEQDGWEHGFEAGATYGHEVNWKVGVPEIADVEKKNKYEVTGKYVKNHFEMNFKGREDMNLTRIIVSYETGTPVKAGGLARCGAVVMQSHVNLIYRATLQHIWKGGERFTYQSTGSFENADSSEALTYCEDVDRVKDGSALFSVREDGIFCATDDRKVGEYDPTQVIDGSACGGMTQLDIDQHLGGVAPRY